MHTKVLHTCHTTPNVQYLYMQQAIYTQCQCRNAMLCCKLAKFAPCTSGGDWGAAVAKMLGIFHSDNCRGIHVNFMIASPNQRNPWHLLQLANAFVPCLNQLPLFLTAGEIEGIKGLSHFQSHESGRDQAPGVECIVPSVISPSPALMPHPTGDLYRSWHEPLGAFCGSESLACALHMPCTRAAPASAVHVLGAVCLLPEAMLTVLSCQTACHELQWSSVRH